MLANQLTQVCKILDISQEDVDRIEVLTILFESIEGALCLRIGEPVVPQVLHWLVNEIVVKRYQLLGAEHLQSESIDVLSSTYKRGDIFGEYSKYIDAYIDNVQAKSEDGKLVTKKKLRML